MNKYVPLFLIITLIFLLVGCDSIRTFVGTLDRIDGEILIINCSSEAVKEEKNVDTIGYLCEVQITEKTKITDKNGNVLEVDHLPVNSTLKITLNNPKNLRKNRKDLIAYEIILLNE